MTFYELENRCKARKRRVYILIIVGIILVFSLIGAFLFLKLQNGKKTKTNEIKKEKKEIKSKKETLKFVLPKVEVKSSNQKLSEEKKNITKNNSKKFLPVINLEEKSKKEKITAKTNTTIEEQNRSKKIVLITNTIPSFDTCINLAKKYLKEGDYKDALKWAKYANVQDKKNPLSWIVSAKALYKEGKKDEALKLLKIYNSYYNNKEVKKLIKEFNEK